MATGVEIAIQHVAETAVQTAADTVIDSSGTALAMADGVGIRALAIALGINMCVAITCFLLLSLFRALKLTRKFYAPKR